MNLGEKIYKLRRKNGLSQENLGEKIGVTRQTISNWELGETTPNITELKQLSKELNISIDELVDNDLKDVIVEKVSNTEKLAGLILNIIKAFCIIVGVGIVILILLLILLGFNKNNHETGRLLNKSIYCKLYGEEHGYNIKYEELTGNIVEAGGDTYFYDILDLSKYSDVNQILNIINDYVKKNGGSCEIIEDKYLNDIIDISIKDGSLTNEEVTLIIKEKIDYDISYGEGFWIEKYNYNDNSFEKLNVINNHCAFNAIAYIIEKDKSLELNQNWSCMYGKLNKGLYRLVKKVFFDSDIPVDESKVFYISVEFEIE